MDACKLSLSILSFGESGMEFISGQFQGSLDEDYITLIGNFYSNVLGAAEESNGLFGPLPVAYKYDILLFLYAFNAYDPNLTDERVIKRNHMTRATMLIFFPTNLDAIFSNQRKNIRNIIENWVDLNIKNDIRKLGIKEILKLKKKIESQIILEIKNSSLDLTTNNDLIKISGKNFQLLNTISTLNELDFELRFVANSKKLRQIIKKSIFLENMDIVDDYKNNDEKSCYKLNKINILEHNSSSISKLSYNFIKGRYDGILIFFTNKNNAAENDYLHEFLKLIVKDAPKRSVISICLDIEEKIGEFLDKTSIANLLAEESDRSISLVYLKDKNNSIEIALIDFIEKIISKVH